MRIAFLSILALISFTQTAIANSINCVGNDRVLSKIDLRVATNVPDRLMPALKGAVDTANAVAGREAIKVNPVRVTKFEMGLDGVSTVSSAQGLGLDVEDTFSASANAYYTHGRIHEIDLLVNSNLPASLFQRKLTRELMLTICPIDRTR